MGRAAVGGHMVPIGRYLVDVEDVHDGIVIDVARGERGHGSRRVPARRDEVDVKDVDDAVVVSVAV